MRFKKPEQVMPTSQNTIHDIIGLVDITNDGVIHTKNGYFSLIEIPAVNFRLKSEQEQRYIVMAYERFLKTVRIPFQVFTIAKKADAKAHIDFMQRQLESETNENVKMMIREYQTYVKDVSYRKAVQKRYIVAIPYVPPAGMKITDMSFTDVNTWLTEKKAQIRNTLMHCGNEIEIPADERRFAAQILFELLNIKSSEKERMVKL